jgi:hypothetical protein
VFCLDAVSLTIRAIAVEDLACQKWDEKVKSTDRLDGNTGSESEIAADFVSLGDLSVGWDEVASVRDAWISTDRGARQAEIRYIHGCMSHQDGVRGPCVWEAII